MNPCTSNELATIETFRKEKHQGFLTDLIKDNAGWLESKFSPTFFLWDVGDWRLVVPFAGGGGVRCKLLWEIMLSFTFYVVELSGNNPVHWSEGLGSKGGVGYSGMGQANLVVISRVEAK